jgi:hypothetical protein
MAAAALVAALIAGGGASVAYAASATTAGAYAYSSGSNRIINAKDTADDGKFVSGGWKSNKGSEGALANKKGFNTTASKTVVSSPESIKSVRACRSNTIGAMTCSSYK